MHEFQSRAVAQALSSLKRWSEEPASAERGDVIVAHLWESQLSKGHVERALVTQDKWSKLNGVRERALYISRSLGHLKQAPIAVSMPKLCPAGGHSIEVLTEVQAVAARLMTPGGPIRRLILQIPPGAGKTCTYLSVIAQFLGNGHSIVIVGDDDVFAVFKEGLRQCPARVQRRMATADGKSAPPETVYLRDINPHMSAFCAVKSQGGNPKLQGSPFQCDPDALAWIDTRVYFFNFVMAGNWMQAWSERRANAKGQVVNSMYHEVNPFSSKLLLVIDEAHKLAVPSMEQTTERWKAAAALFPKYLASLGKDKGSNPYILVGTATVNTTQMPTLSLCLPRVVKGYTDPALFVDDDVSKPPRLNLHAYLLPSSGFVRVADRVTLTSFPPLGFEAEALVLPVKGLKERLERYRGFSEAAPKKGAKSARDDVGHPCPVSVQALRDAAHHIYEPVDTEENRKRLLDIWSNVVFIVDTSRDYRYYPTADVPYPALRAVGLPSASRADEYLRLLEKPQGSARWTEVSQFADQTRLMSLVQGCLDGEPLDLALIESLAPKWEALAADLLTDPRLRGRTMVYPGVYNRRGCDDNYYLLLLAFYLRAKLRPYVRRHCAAGVKEHQLITLESALHGSGEAERSAAPAIYIVGDSAEGKYLEREIAGRLQAAAAAAEEGKAPRAEDLVVAMSTRAFRERQYNRYNDEACPGAGDAPPQAAGNTIIILAEGGHKALDLKCTSNGCILSTMPGGKFQQTQGRVRRSCAFRTLPDTKLWTVHVRVYLLWAEGCLRQGPVLDQALHSFYHAQYQIIRYLEMIEAMAGIGCSNWELYSNWKATFKDFERYPQGGFKCEHDADPGERSALNQNLWDFFFCSGRQVRRGISGDVSADYVTKSAQGACSEEHVVEPQSARSAIAAVKEMFAHPNLRAELTETRRRHVSPARAPEARPGSAGQSSARALSSRPEARLTSRPKTERRAISLTRESPSRAANRRVARGESATAAPESRILVSSSMPSGARRASSVAPPVSLRQALEEMRRRVQASVDAAGSKWEYSRRPE
jgi:hypothetical protein